MLSEHIHLFSFCQYIQMLYLFSVVVLCIIQNGKPIRTQPRVTRGCYNVRANKKLKLLMSAPLHNPRVVYKCIHTFFAPKIETFQYSNH
jgi:hypothetical protein